MLSCQIAFSSLWLTFTRTVIVRGTCQNAIYLSIDLSNSVYYSETDTDPLGFIPVCVDARPVVGTSSAVRTPLTRRILWQHDRLISAVSFVPFTTLLIAFIATPSLFLQPCTLLRVF